MTSVTTRALNTQVLEWNNLPQHVTSAPSMPVFRSRLKAFLFRRSFPSLLPQLLSFSDTLSIFLLTYLLEKEMEKWCHLWRDRKTSIEGAEVTRFRNVFHVRAAATGKGANN